MKVKEDFLASLEFLQRCYSSRERFKRFKKNKIVVISDVSGILKDIKFIWDSLFLKRAKYYKFKDFKFKESKSSFPVIVHVKPLTNFLSEFNTYCLKNKIKFVKGMLRGSEFLLVPFLLPYEGPCYNCYSILKSYNFVVDQDTFRGNLILPINSYPRVWIWYSMLFLTLKLSDWMTKDVYTREDIAEYVVNLEKLSVTSFPLLRSPICPFCKNPDK
jgi:hypothetical protein